MEERTAIADLRREKNGVCEIAEAIGRSPATVSRELRRNAGRYLPALADRQAEGLVARPGGRRLLLDDELRAVVNDLLGTRWSPAQVAHELRKRFPGQPDRHCAQSRFTGPCTTPPSRFPAHPGDAVAVGDVSCRAKSVADGFSG